MAMTDRQVEQQLEQAANAPETPVTPGTFFNATPAGAIVLPDGTKAPGSATMAGPVAAGSAPLGSAGNFYATPAPTSVPTVDPTGKVIGYTVTTYNWDGSANPAKYTPVASVTGPTGSTGASGATGSSTDAQLAALQKQLADLQATTAAQTASAQATAAQTQQNAIQFLTTTFQNYGLSADIAQGVTNLVQQGYTSDTIQLIAQDPNSKDPVAVAFQQRFPANAARLKAGLPVLSPGQYISTEQSYAQVMQAYGLSSDFATNKDVFTKLLSADVSPTELNTRVSTAKQVVDNTDPLVTQQLQQYYGLTQADMIAHVLDPSVATPIIEKQISAAQIGAQSARYGINVGQGQAEQLSGLGVTQAQANQGFQNIASQLPNTQSLATRYGAYGPAGDVGQALQAATFGTTGSVNAQAELDRLRMQEVSQFSGSSGVGKGSISQLEEGVS
jgi:hypothetical protein